MNATPLVGVTDILPHWNWTYIKFIMNVILDWAPEFWLTVRVKLNAPLEISSNPSSGMYKLTSVFEA